jgi:hypothetical protein
VTPLEGALDTGMHGTDMMDLTGFRSLFCHHHLCHTFRTLNTLVSVLVSVALCRLFSTENGVFKTVHQIKTQLESHESDVELEQKDTWKVSHGERHEGIVVTRWNCCLCAVDCKHSRVHAVLIVWLSK